MEEWKVEDPGLLSISTGRFVSENTTSTAESWQRSIGQSIRWIKKKAYKFQRMVSVSASIWYEGFRPAIYSS